MCFLKEKRPTLAEAEDFVNRSTEELYNSEFGRFLKKMESDRAEEAAKTIYKKTGGDLKLMEALLAIINGNFDSRLGGKSHWISGSHWASHPALRLDWKDIEDLESILAFCNLELQPASSLQALRNTLLLIDMIRSTKQLTPSEAFNVANSEVDIKSMVRRARQQ